MDFKIETVVVPVSDVDRTIAFYKNLGWRFDGDFKFGKGIRGVQFTPPGSHCSIIFGTGMTEAKPGSLGGHYVVVSDLEAALEELAAKGAKIGQTQHRGADGKLVPGLDPERRSYFSYASFQDPDGNTWLLQEITQRLPGRADGETEFHSETELATALKRASEAHGRHEAKSGGKRDENWPAWYAKYLVQEQSGGRLPS